MRVHLWSIVAASLFLAAPALAASPEEPDPELRDEARALFVAAVQAHDRGAWGECRAKLLTAWGVLRHWSIAGNLAECEIELGRFRDAAEHAAYALSKAPADRKPKAQALLAKAAARVGRLVLDGVEGRELAVDGASQGTGGLETELWVEPGRRRLRVGEATTEIEVPAGSTRTVRFRPSPVLRWTAVGLGAAGLMALGVATGFTVAANGDARSATALRGQLGNGLGACNVPSPSCSTLRSDLHAQDVASRAAVGLFVTGGVLAASAATVAVLGRTPRQATLTVGAGLGTVTLSGRW